MKESVIFNLRSETRRPLYRCAVFDLDGTLLDTLQDLTDAVNAAMTACGEPCYSPETIRSYVGNGIYVLMERALPGGRKHPLYSQAMQIFQEYYAAHGTEHTCLYPGISKLLWELQAHAIPMAVVSNKHQAGVTALHDTYFSKQISLAIGTGEFTKKKPEPDTVWEALRQLAVSREAALYIGDSEVDAMTAQNAGVDCALVSWGFRSRSLLEQYSHVLLADTPSQLLPFFLSPSSLQ